MFGIGRVDCTYPALDESPTTARFSQAWISRCELGSAPPPNPRAYAELYDVLEGPLLELPQRARQAATTELLLAAAEPLLDIRGQLADAIHEGLCESTHGRVVLTSRAQQAFPELMWILCVGRARLVVAFEEMLTISESARARLLPRDGRGLSKQGERRSEPTAEQLRHVREEWPRLVGAYPPAERVNDLAQSLCRGGLRQDTVENWADAAFLSDIADAWVHLEIVFSSESPKPT